MGAWQPAGGDSVALLAARKELTCPAKAAFSVGVSSHLAIGHGIDPAAAAAAGRGINNTHNGNITITTIM